MTQEAWTGKKPEGIEKSVSVLDRLEWTVQPPLGLITGNYWCEEMDFAPHHSLDRGYHGCLEVVESGGSIVHVEFNEWTSPAYYIPMYQNISKRRSDYCFFQATKERTALTLKVLNNGIQEVERQMVEENRLIGDFDLVSGASNSVRRGMLPLARKIEAIRPLLNNKKYYGIAESNGNGITCRLQIVIDSARIVKCSYDEIFADHPDEISDPQLKKYYRQSKYDSIQYESEYPDGFNNLVDLLEERVLLTQNLLDLSGLPWTEQQNNRKPWTGWDRYLNLAKLIKSAVKADGVLPW